MQAVFSEGDVCLNCSPRLTQVYYITLFHVLSKFLLANERSIATETPRSPSRGGDKNKPNDTPCRHPAYTANRTEDRDHPSILPVSKARPVCAVTPGPSCALDPPSRARRRRKEARHAVVASSQQLFLQPRTSWPNITPGALRCCQTGSRTLLTRTPGFSQSRRSIA